MLDYIPVEILYAICEYVGHSYPPSVLSLALANKRCYAVACPFLYQTIFIEACHPEQLVLDTKRCEDLLRRDSAFSHVRRFILHGQLQKPCRRDHSLEKERMPLRKIFASLYNDVDDGDDDEGIIMCLTESLPYRTAGEDDVDPMDACWESLCRLVESLPGVTDFMFALCNMLPPRLLETLHNQFPASSLRRLRLHVFRFTLPNLAAGKSDPHELALASSPLLHRICAEYDDTEGFDQDGRPSYHGEITMELVQGFAPNLKDVRLFQDSGDPEDAYGRPLPPPPAWKRFSKGAPMPGSLRCLKLDGVQMSVDYRFLLKKDLQRWKTSTDFSVLETLNLRQRVDKDGLTFLRESCSFPNLTSLTLHYNGLGTHKSIKRLHKFLCALPKLRFLELLGNCARTLGASPTAFYPNLRRLRLPTEPGESSHGLALHSIIRSCPNIEDLTLAVPRHRGAADEVDLYRTIGALPRLRRLHLALDASCPTPETRRYSLPTHADSLGAHVAPLLTSLQFSPDRPILDAFIDSAIDANLALAIFHAISQGKGKDKGKGKGKGQPPHPATNTNTPPIPTRPLEILYLHVVGAGDWAVAERASSSSAESDLLRKQMDPYLRVLARPWSVIRSPRDDCRDVVHVVEAYAAPRPKTLARYREEGAKGELLRVFRLMWPEKSPGSDWVEDWRSWPLEGVDDE